MLKLSLRVLKFVSVLLLMLLPQRSLAVREATKCILCCEHQAVYLIRLWLASGGGVQSIVQSVLACTAHFSHRNMHATADRHQVLQTHAQTELGHCICTD